MNGKHQLQDPLLRAWVSPDRDAHRQEIEAGHDEWDFVIVVQEGFQTFVVCLLVASLCALSRR